jgi:hypothetical protein
MLGNPEVIVPQRTTKGAKEVSLQKKKPPVRWGIMVIHPLTEVKTT